MSGSLDYHMCTICAVRLYECSSRDILYHIVHGQEGPSQWYPDIWRESVALLSGPTWPLDEKGPQSMTVPNEKVTQYIAEASWYPARVYIPGSNAPVVLQDQNLPEIGENHDLDTKRWYLAVHSACEDIANRVMRTSRDASIRSMGDLWMTLERRCVSKKAWGEIFFFPYLPVIPDNQPGEPIKLGLGRYYIPTAAIPGDQMDYDDDVEEWWEDDPLHVPNLTTSLLSNLQQWNSKNSTNAPFSVNFENLPSEITDEIVAHLMDQAITLECNYLMPQSFWKQALLQIPFLWDIDTEIVREKSRQAELARTEWDWEKMTRQLMIPVTVADQRSICNPVTWSYKQVGLIVPSGLNNRRRIWQILEDMYPNDVGVSNRIDADGN
ncbi:Fc.00g096810.m01.CDS01 [Cosmosporella sp. VM-42]